MTKCIPVRRNQITEIPSNSIEDYYRIEVEAWKQLPQVVAPGEFGQVRCFTNLFLLEHSVEYPEILLKSEEEFRLYSELKRAVKNTEIDGEGNEMGFRIGNLLILFESKEIHIYHEHNTKNACMTRRRGENDIAYKYMMFVVFDQESPPNRNSLLDSRRSFMMCSVPSSVGR